MVWLPGKSAFSYASAKGAVSTAGFPVGGISNIDDIDASTNTISETAVNGATVGITANATDPTVGDTISYVLSDDAGGRFTIDSSSFQIWSIARTLGSC